jgi:putative glutathione S-transferase
VRFDVAYHGARRCNLRRLAGYPGLLGDGGETARSPASSRRSRLEHVKLPDDRETIEIAPSGSQVDFATIPAARAA